MGGFLLIVFIIILIFGVGVFGTIARLLKSIFTPGGGGQPNQSRPTFSRKQSSSSRKKLIDKNEGEYVDFEEVR
jgi:hypothetical protein